MGKQAPRMSARVVNAIRNLREARGSTSKEIMNYIMAQYSAPESTILRQMQAALKRGLDYGILKKNNGHYFLNTEADLQQLSIPALMPVERSRRRRRSRARRRRRSRGKRRRKSRRRRGRSRRRRRGRYRSARTKQISRSRKASKKRRNPKQTLSNSPVEQRIEENDLCLCEKESETERRSRHNKSQDRRRSRSRSWVNSDRDGVDDRQEIQDQD